MCLAFLVTPQHSVRQYHYLNSCWNDCNNQNNQPKKDQERST